MATTPSPSILNYFKDLPDPRRETKNKKHHLIDLLVLALCGVIAGCDSAVEIEAYGQQKLDWLKTFLELPNGIPSHDILGAGLTDTFPDPEDCERIVSSSARGFFLIWVTARRGTPWRGFECN
jgi:hypothetical protein